VDDNRILIDQDTGLHVGWYFWLRVLDEVNRSSRYGSPFGLLILEAEPPGASRKTLDEASSRVPGAIRGTDLAGRLGGGGAGVMLLEQDADGAAAGTERILTLLAARPSPITWRANLYCYPRDGASISNLLTRERGDGVSEQRRRPA
jgi:hypothetical protein